LEKRAESKSRLSVRNVKSTERNSETARGNNRSCLEISGDITKKEREQFGSKERYRD